MSSIQKKNARARAMPPEAGEKPLAEILDLLHRARLESSLGRIGLIKEQFLQLFVRVEQGELSSRDAHTLSINLQRELSGAIWNLKMCEAPAQKTQPRRSA